MLLMGDVSPAECSLLPSPSPFLFSPTFYLPSQAGDARTTVWKFFFPILFPPPQSRQCGKRDIIKPLDDAIPSVEGRHRRELTPQPIPCSLNPDSGETEYSHPRSVCSDTARCGVSSPQGRPSHRDEANSRCWLFLLWSQHADLREVDTI